MTKAITVIDLDKLDRMTTPAPSYNRMTLAQIDAAIMYQVEYGTDLKRLDSLLAARKRFSQKRKAVV